MLANRVPADVLPLRSVAAAGGRSLAGRRTRRRSRTLSRHATSSSSCHMLTRPIGKTGEHLPVIGMGSSNTFDVGVAPDERAPLLDVLRELHAAGGTVIDTSPMYGRSEGVLGDLIEELALRPKLWLATKVWTKGREAGEQQIAASMRELGVDAARPAADPQPARLAGARADAARAARARARSNTSASRTTAPTRTRTSSACWARRSSTSCSSTTRSPNARPSSGCCRSAATAASRCWSTGRSPTARCSQRVRDKPLPPIAKELGIASWGQYFLKWIVGAPGGHLRDPGDVEAEAHAGQLSRRLRPVPDARQREQWRRRGKSAADRLRSRR